MFVIIYVVLTAFITWKIAKLFFSLKFKYDIKFTENIVRNVLVVIQEEKKKIKRPVEEVDEE